MSNIAILVAAAALAVGLAACGGGSGGPQEIADEATFQGIESGDVSLDLAIDVTGREAGHVDVSLSGPFKEGSTAGLPELDLTATAKGSLGGEDVDFDGGVTLLGERAFVRYEGTDYAVDPTTFGFLKATLLQQSGQQSGEVSACQEGFGNLEVGALIENPTEEGSVDVGGASTTKVSGDLDVASALDALIELTEDPDCRRQLNTTGQLPSTAKLKRDRDRVQNSVKEARVELYVGDDDIVRRIVAEVAIEPPPGSGRESAKSVDLDLDLTLTGVNEEQKISAPRNTTPLSQLFLDLGISPLGLLEQLENEDLGSGGLDSLLEGIRGAGGK